MSEVSILLAKAFGIYAIAKGLAILVRQKTLPALVKDFIGNRELMFIVAALELLGGIFIVISHNIWVPSWEVIITIFGWLMLIEGAFFFILPHKTTKRLVMKFLSNKFWYQAGGIIAIILGIYLVNIGFSLGF